MLKNAEFGAHKIVLFLGLFVQVGLVGKSSWRRENRGPSVNKLICHVKGFRLHAIGKTQLGAGGCP